MKKMSFLLFLVFCMVSCQKNSASNTADSYTITASSSGNGTISPTGVMTVTPGTSVYYSLKPDPGRAIASITVDGTSVPFTSSTTQYTFPNVQANHTINVAFTEFFVVTTSVNDGLGSITPSSPLIATGGSVSFTLKPNAGYKLDSLWLDGKLIPNTNPYQLSNVLSNHTLRAYFNLTQTSLDSLKNLIIGKWRMTSFQSRLMSSPTSNFFSYTENSIPACAANDYDTYSMTTYQHYYTDATCETLEMQFRPPFPNQWTLKKNGKVIYLTGTSLDSLTNITVTKDSLITYYYAGYTNGGHIGYHYHYVRTQ